MSLLSFALARNLNRDLLVHGTTLRQTSWAMHVFFKYKNGVQKNGVKYGSWISFHTSTNRSVQSFSISVWSPRVPLNHILFKHFFIGRHLGGFQFFF